MSFFELTGTISQFIGKFAPWHLENYEYALSLYLCPWPVSLYLVIGSFSFIFLLRIKSTLAVFLSEKHQAKSIHCWIAAPKFCFWCTLGFFHKLVPGFRKLSFVLSNSSIWTLLKFSEKSKINSLFPKTMTLLLNRSAIQIFLLIFEKLFQYLHIILFWDINIFHSRVTDRTISSRRNCFILFINLHG